MRRSETKAIDMSATTMTQVPPSAFTSFPSGSVLHKLEWEKDACGLMKARTALDRWDITYTEYREARLAAGLPRHRLMSDPDFATLVKYIPGSLGAISFSPDWAKDARAYLKKHG